MKNLDKYLEVGKIVNTHGIKGDIKIYSWCDSPDIIAQIKTLYLSNPEDNGEFTPVLLTHASVYKNMVYAKIDGVDSVEKAMGLKDKILYAVRSDIAIKDGDIFIVDLIGLDLIDIDTGIVYGSIKDVIQNSANDIYVVETEKGEVYIPAVNEFIKNIDSEKGIFIKPIEGMFP